MKLFSRLPLYLGLSILVVAVILAAIRVGQENTLTNIFTRATNTNANLTLAFSAPDLVSVSLTSDKEIAGVDVAIKYDKNRATILPSTLSAGSSFITTGGVIDEANSLFSFSALTRGSVSSGVIATFKVTANTGGEGMETNLQFETDSGKTAIIEKGTSANILNQATGVTLNLPNK